jgi:hypothetical protein
MDFNFSHSQVLEDETVLLRYKNQISQNLLEISINEPETWQYSLVRTMAEKI